MEEQTERRSTTVTDDGTSVVSSASSHKQASPADDGKLTIERKINLLGGVGFVIGQVIGSGIFVSPTGVTENTKSEGLSLLVWGIGGLISLFGALSFAELGTMIPKSGGDYNYLRITYAKWVGFLFGWNNGILVKPSSAAIVSMTCTKYILVAVFYDGCGEPPSFLVKLSAALVVLLLTATNCFSIRLSANIQIIFMIGKVAALIIIVIGGIIRLINGHTEHLATGFEGSNKNAGEIIMAFYSALYAYDSWYALTYVTEEVINPKRTLPLSFLIALPTIIFLYMMVNVSYFTVMSAEELVQSPAVAITWAQEVIPEVSWLVPIFVAMSTFGSLNGNIFTTGRILWVMAREGEMPQAISYIHHTRKTPIPAAIFTCVLSIFYIMAGEISELIDFLSFTKWALMAFAQLAVVILRYRADYKHVERVYKVPLVFPIIMFIFCIALVVVPLVDSPQIEFLYASIIMLSGLLFYFPISYYNHRPSCMKKVTEFMQLLMELCPTQMDEEAKND